MKPTNNKEKSYSSQNISNSNYLNEDKSKNLTTKNLMNVNLSKLKQSILNFNDFLFIKKEEFQHPSHENLLILEGYSLNDNQKDQIKELLTLMNNSHHETEEYLKFCYSIILILRGYFTSEEYLYIIKSNTQKLLDLYSNSVIYPQISCYKDNIILDLDETLIHSETPINLDKSYNYIISEKNIGLFVRPYLIELLKEISEYYNIFLFSAGEADYVKCVLDKIGCNSYFSLVLSREFCISPTEDLYIKDLNMFQNFINEYIKRNPESLLNSKIENINDNIDLPQETIIADNHILSFSNNLSQGVLVNDYFGDQEDDELLALSEFLAKLKNAKHDSGVSLSFLLNKSFDYSSY